jgi:hypothetical protein
MFDKLPSVRDRRYVWSCVAINQFATPGLGSLLCRRWIAGAGQLLLALAGFTLVVGWMASYFYRRMSDLTSPATVHASTTWMLKWGGLFLARGGCGRWSRARACCCEREPARRRAWRIFRPACNGLAGVVLIYCRCAVFAVHVNREENAKYV